MHEALPCSPTKKPAGLVYRRRALDRSQSGLECSGCNNKTALSSLRFPPLATGTSFLHRNFNCRNNWILLTVVCALKRGGSSSSERRTTFSYIICSVPNVRFASPLARFPVSLVPCFSKNKNKIKTRLEQIDELRDRDLSILHLQVTYALRRYLKMTKFTYIVVRPGAVHIRKELINLGIVLTCFDQCLGLFPPSCNNKSISTIGQLATHHQPLFRFCF